MEKIKYDDFVMDLTNGMIDTEELVSDMRRGMLEVMCTYTSIGAQEERNDDFFVWTPDKSRLDDFFYQLRSLIDCIEERGKKKSA